MADNNGIDVIPVHWVSNFHSVTGLRVDAVSLDNYIKLLRQKKVN